MAAAVEQHVPASPRARPCRSSRRRQSSSTLLPRQHLRADRHDPRSRRARSAPVEGASGADRLAGIGRPARSRRADGNRVCGTRAASIRRGSPDRRSAARLPHPARRPTIAGMASPSSSRRARRGRGDRRRTGWCGSARRRPAGDDPPGSLPRETMLPALDALDAELTGSRGLAGQTLAARLATGRAPRQELLSFRTASGPGLPDPATMVFVRATAGLRYGTAAAAGPGHPAALATGRGPVAGEPGTERPVRDLARRRFDWAHDACPGRRDGV
ncbi:hypothetical protein HBB16_21735 [Pseudonocardia sp. MCCB 268]|nr:hypothetical protein [Pseudonocardia cytotoxica]